MERARGTWTDERLDDLSSRVEEGFNRVDQDLRALSARIDAQGAELSGRIDAQGAELSRRIDAATVELSGRIDAHAVEVSRRFDVLHRILVQFGGGITLAVLATLVSVLATRA